MKHSAVNGAEPAEPLHQTPEQARCDAVQPAFRKADAPLDLFREPPPKPAEISPTDDVLNLRLAEELDYARRMLDQLGDDLAADMGVVMRHSVALQVVDIAGQMLGHIAAVVRSSEREASVERIGMCDLKARLLRRGGV